MNAEIVDLKKWKIDHPPHAIAVQSTIGCYIAWWRFVLSFYGR